MCGSGGEAASLTYYQYSCAGHCCVIVAILFRRGYWEPAKFVAKLRHMKTDSNLLLVSKGGCAHAR